MRDDCDECAYLIERIEECDRKLDGYYLYTARQIEKIDTARDTFEDSLAAHLRNCPTCHAA